MSDVAALAAALALLELEIDVARLGQQVGPWRRALFDHERQAGTNFAGIDAATRRAREQLGLLLVRARRTLLDALQAGLLARSDLHDATDAGEALLDPQLTAAAAFVDGYRGLYEMVRSQLVAVARAEADRAVAELRRQGGQVGRVDEAGLIAAADAQARRLASGVLSDVARTVQAAAGDRGLGGFGDGAAADLIREVIADARGRSERGLTDLASQAVNASGGAGRLAGLYAVRQGDAVRWYASELLDDRTCVPCGEVDGKQYASLEEAQQDYPAGVYDGCLGGARCRGTLVAVLADEVPASR